MDFGAPIAQNVNVNPQQGLQTLSSLLQLKQQQASVSQAQSQAQVAAINAGQTQALSQQNWGQFINKDGTINTPAASQLAFKVAPNLASEFVGRLADSAKSSAEMTRSFLALNAEQQAPLRAIAGAYAANPQQKFSDMLREMETYQSTAPKTAQPYIQSVIDSVAKLAGSPNTVTGAPHTDQETRQLALAFSRGGLTPAEASGPGGLATPQAGTVSTGTQVIPTTTNRETGVTAAASAPPIASQSETVTLPNSQLVVLNKQTGQYQIAGGGGAGPGPGPGGASAGTTAPPVMTAANDPARPSPNAPAPVWTQWTASLAAAQNIVSAARSEDAGYGVNMAIAQDVRALGDLSKTGPGTPEWTRLIGSITSRFGGSQGVTNVQTIESFLDRQAAGLTKAMGLPSTNLGNEQARTIGGNIGMQPGALQAKNNFNEALVAGLHDYRQGLDRVAGFAGNASPTAVGKFQSEWTKYFNPTAMEYRLAMERGDRKAQDAIVKGITPAQARRMKVDLEMIDSLAKTGRLP